MSLLSFTRTGCDATKPQHKLIVMLIDDDEALLKLFRSFHNCVQLYSVNVHEREEQTTNMCSLISSTKH